jgi:hypothetical protein
VAHPLGNTTSAQAAPENVVHNVYEQKSIKYTIIYLHACCFIPVQDTWLKAIQNGHFATWQYVTMENVLKYLPKYDSMVKGHMNQIRQNIRSTQPSVVEPTPESEMVQEDKCNFMYSTIMETNQIYTYVTGRFTTNSLSCNKYILILYDYYRNSVLSAPMKNRGDKDMIRSFDLFIQSLFIRGLKPILQCLDNEETLALRKYEEINNQPMHVCLCPTQWEFLFQQDGLGAPWNPHNFT